ncbi:MAG TPA: Na(+)-translocating NADH-quinone reductase subunit C [Flavobacteriaceae bacterium]|mgnify:CR=1 FL=1|jgi:Na+-transporting NADH:ubiquinone oxidoreductase subunit C|nr:Na(+)-translocating NADH-quinone reductase subunit C [Flavobacteriaceae bacterium]MAY52812.1 Na(+)-translocating NADH-quinone reductase subunit C [Flavobacteriaceae bacterium]HBR53535.1 Na(+)-translocating NADH-quinone reductase subunit C [Flavobacteriaceae bacterium]HIB48835.1 Na(+)-translocating NADH-quinone reductase subunit C [Flavobacteriaceae bacterium]HIN99517.1 Na(+)-translocating NADH-quinone reductase subunit C [Flavobacteriaceae bacterium]|tara:strand:+ start:3942 stop:4691 length:750 start_codon:yes stop_codon:yes gene_type:complete
MAINTDKNSYTVIFAVIMVVVVGSLLAGFASGLKPMIKANEKFEKQQNILYAMNVNDNEGDSDVAFIPTDRVEEEFNKYITKQLVIQGDDVKENDEAYLIDLKKEETKAKDPDYQRKLPLFVGEKDGKEVYVIPVRGKGLWDAIWGFVAVDKSMTVQGVYFDHKGETPGLGAEIKQRYFMDDFTGEKFLNGNAFEGIEVAKGNNDPLNKDTTDNQVDALAGATITGDGVSAMLRKDIKLYVPYFKSLNQ